MPKYRNATNRVLILNGVKIPPGGIIETTEELAKQAKGALAFVPEGPVPRIVSVPSRQTGGLTEEERQRLENLENMFSNVAHMFENVEQMTNRMPELMQNMKESISEEIRSAQPTVVEKTIIQGGEGKSVTETYDPNVPVILDDATSAESNIGESSDSTEKEAGSVQSKLDKLRKLKGVKDE